MAKGYQLMNNDGSVSLGAGSTSAGSVIATAALGGITAANYTFVYDTTSQTNTASNTFQDITLDTNAVLNGWSHTASTATFTCNTAGTYIVSVYASGIVTAGAIRFIEVVALKGASQIPGSQIITEIATNNQQIPVCGQFIETFAASDTLKFQFATSAGIGNAALTQALGVATVKPSIAITITRIV